MLIIPRKKCESVVIGDDIVVTIVDIRGDKVRLGFQCPKEVPVHRTEIYDSIRALDEYQDKTPSIPSFVAPPPPTIESLQQVIERQKQIIQSQAELIRSIDARIHSHRNDMAQDR